MGTFFYYSGFRFYAYSGDHRPLHVHISFRGAEAKIKIEDGIQLIYNNGFSDRTINQLIDIVTRLQKRIIAEWETQLEDQ